jgi:NAD(P)H dehydrogenase (quinone)
VAPIIAVTRRPEALADLAARGVEVRRADFDDPAGLATAFAGAARALLVSTDKLDGPAPRLGQHQNAVRALAAAGVKHVVYTSMPSPVDSPVLIAADHAGTEAALAATSLDFTILRNNIYAEMILPGLPAALASGRLVDARGSGAVAYVTREDCARAATAAVLEAAPGRRTLDVTGPQAFTGDELAALVSELAGRPVAHLSIPAPALVQAMVEHGLPRPLAEIYASFDVGAERGLLAGVSDTVLRLTGTPPRSLREFLTGKV